MNTANKRDIPAGADIEAIMDKLSEVDTTITLARVLQCPRLEVAQDDKLITRKVKERLSRSSSKEIQEINIFIEQLERLVLSEIDELAILMELKMELADNLGKSITAIIQQSYMNMSPTDSHKKVTSQNIRAILDPHQHDAPNILQ